MAETHVYVTYVRYVSFVQRYTVGGDRSAELQGERRQESLKILFLGRGAFFADQGEEEVPGEDSIAQQLGATDIHPLLEGLEKILLRWREALKNAEEGTEVSCLLYGRPNLEECALRGVQYFVGKGFVLQGDEVLRSRILTLRQEFGDVRDRRNALEDVIRESRRPPSRS